MQLLLYSNHCDHKWQMLDSGTFWTWRTCQWNESIISQLMLHSIICWTFANISHKLLVIPDLIWLKQQNSWIFKSWFLINSIFICKRKNMLNLLASTRQTSSSCVSLFQLVFFLEDLYQHYHTCVLCDNVNKTVFQAHSSCPPLWLSLTIRSRCDPVWGGGLPVTLLAATVVCALGAAVGESSWAEGGS